MELSSIRLNEILKRQANRKAITKTAAGYASPPITDPEALKDYKSDLGKLQTAYLDACFLVDYDIDVLRKTLELIGPEPAFIEDAISKAAELVPMDATARARLEAIKEAEEEAERVRKGDVKGQMKLVKDDGSIAEEASAVSHRKISTITEVV